MMQPTKSKPAALEVSQANSATSPNEDGNAAHTENSTVAAELARIADELHQLNGSLTLTRHDGTVTVTLARLIAEMGNGRVSIIHR